MRWFRLFLLGLTSIYPLYWTAQFALFFLPAALHAVVFRIPLAFIGISFLQASAFTGKSDPHLASFESLLVAPFLSFAIWILRGDKFLTGGLAITILGQAAIFPFLNQILWQGEFARSILLGALLSLGLVTFGLYRTLRRMGCIGFVDRLALLSLLAVLPQALLWFTFRMIYPFFGTRFLLILLVPLYLGALFASAIPGTLKGESVRSSRTWVSAGEILASSVVTCLLMGALGLVVRSSAHPRPTAANAAWHVRPS